MKELLRKSVCFVAKGDEGKKRKEGRKKEIRGITSVLATFLACVQSDSRVTFPFS